MEGFEVVVPENTHAELPLCSLQIDQLVYSGQHDRGDDGITEPSPPVSRLYTRVVDEPFD